MSDSFWTRVPREQWGATTAQRDLDAREERQRYPSVAFASDVTRNSERAAQKRAREKRAVAS